MDIYYPWGKVRAHLLSGLGAATRCQCIMLTAADAKRIHVFVYGSDIERSDLLYTSVLIQMWHPLVAARLPDRCASPRAQRRSWLLGFATAVIGRVRAAEEAADRADEPGPAGSPSRTALVLADRDLVIRSAVQREYPVIRTVRMTYSGTGYGAGYAQGQRADIGTRRVTPRSGRQLGDDAR